MALTMPHSPRLHEGRLMLLNFAMDALYEVDPATGMVQEIALFRGLPRGLALAGGTALVGLSLPRDDAFAGLPLEQRPGKDVEAECGVWVVDLATGRHLHTL